MLVHFPRVHASYTVKKTISRPAIYGKGVHIFKVVGFRFANFISEILDSPLSKTLNVQARDYLCTYCIGEHPMLRRAQLHSLTRIVVDRIHKG